MIKATQTQLDAILRKYPYLDRKFKALIPAQDVATGLVELHSMRYRTQLEQANYLALMSLAYLDDVPTTVGSVWDAFIINKPKE